MPKVIKDKPKERHDPYKPPSDTKLLLQRRSGDEGTDDELADIDDNKRLEKAITGIGDIGIKLRF